MVSLEFEQDHPEAKLYGLRVVVLANNELYWFGHKLVVADTRRQVATAWP
jgi:hypothetical protein